LIGGALIGLAATLLYAMLGRIAGVSGIVTAAVEHKSERGWRIGFLFGLILAAGLWLAASGIAPRAGFPLPWLIAAGLLVGFGTRLGGGCTSGHGICGLSRLSRRSLVAVVVFMGFGALTVYVLRHVIGGIA
jgi:uncharacterized membrane protein YedE/YeeE